MVQMHNVTVSLAQAEERAPQLESAEGNEPPVYAPPYEQVPTVRLPTKEQHLRPGGTISGPTLVWLADLSFYLLIMGRLGPVAAAVTIV